MKAFDNTPELPTSDYEAEIMGTVGDRLREAAKGTNGVLCPCCRKKNKVYPRKLIVAVVLPLIYTVKWFEDHPDKYLNILRYISKHHDMTSGSHAKARFWGLLEQPPVERRERGEQPRSGMWRMTSRGFDFVHRKLRLQETCVEYRSVPLWFEGPKITIDQALTNEFIYDDLLRDVYENYSPQRRFDI